MLLLYCSTRILYITEKPCQHYVSLFLFQKIIQIIQLAQLTAYDFSFPRFEADLALLVLKHNDRLKFTDDKRGLRPLCIPDAEDVKLYQLDNLVGKQSTVFNLVFC